MQSEIVANWIWDVNILLVLERKLIWMNCAAAGGVGTPSLPRAAVKVSSLRSRLFGCATHYFYSFMGNENLDRPDRKLRFLRQ